MIIINKYNKFILESTLYDIILESKLKYKNDFKNILTDINDTSNDIKVNRLVSFLMSIYDEDLKLTQNYIGVNGVDKLSFIPDSKIKVSDEYFSLTLNDNNSFFWVLGLGLSLIDDLGISRVNLHAPSHLKDISINKWIKVNTYKGIGPYEEFLLHYLRNSEDNYYVIAIEHINGLGKSGMEPYVDVPEKLKGTIKIGRFINKIVDIFFKENPNTTFDRKDFNDSTIEKFVNLYSATILFNENSDNFFEIVRGDDIRKWYDESNYATQSGELGNSCMKYTFCQSYFRIYTENPEVCEMLIFFNNERTKILGRALLWTDINGKKFIDRIYAFKNSHLSLFIKWANKNSYKELYESETKVKVKIKNKNYEEYPYMDSLLFFKFTDDRTKLEEGVVESDEPAYLLNYKVSNCYILQKTTGRFRITNY